MIPMNDPSIVDTCKTCGKPIYDNDLYFVQVGDKKGPYHHYDCRKKR